MTAMIPAESLPYFEKMIYLPFLLTILERDRDVFETEKFKIGRPYVLKVEKVIKDVRNDLIETKKYLRDNNMRLLRGENDGSTTTYMFFYGGYEQSRRYLNVRLRNRTEELLEVYLMKD